MALMNQWNNVIPNGYIPSVNDPGFIPRIDATDGLYSWSSTCGSSYSGNNNPLLKSSNPLVEVTDGLNTSTKSQHPEYTKYVLIILGNVVFSIIYVV